MADDREVAVAVKNIHKEFVLPQNKNTTIKQTVANIVRKNGKTTQKVLDGISFEVHKGDFFGIVGRNGSGKSTLLKMIAGVYTPTSGSIEINGGLTPFIELGVGFNPELSGRDNIYLNGALLGYSHKQMDVMYDDIVAFAELEPFMDQKLKNYSSGMQVRLAFSIAIKAKNDILIFDEVLAVGDEAFQRKCNDYFNEIRNDQNQTVILVTHSMETVKKYCNRAVMLKDGNVVAHGDPYDVANRYSLENLEEITPNESEDNNGIINKPGVGNLKLSLLSDKQVNQDGIIELLFEYDVTKDIDTIPHISIVDIDRNVWIQNDNMWNSVIKGAGSKAVVYKTNLPSIIGNSTLKIQAGLRDRNNEILGYIDDRYSPRIMVQRSDARSRHAAGLATGIVFKSGTWSVK